MQRYVTRNLLSKQVIKNTELLCCNTTLKYYCKSSSQYSSQSSSTGDASESNTNKTSQRRAKVSQDFMKFKARRRSFSPMERVGNLISESEADNELNETSAREEALEGRFTAEYAEDPTNNTDSNTNKSGNITCNSKPKRSVMPSRRLQSMIPSEYWTKESEDTKKLVDDLGSNIDTKEEK